MDEDELGILKVIRFGEGEDDGWMFAQVLPEQQSGLRRILTCISQQVWAASKLIWRL